MARPGIQSIEVAYELRRFPVKLNVLLFVFAALLATFCEQANAIDMANLSLTPFESRKKPPKAPPYTLMHKSYNSSTSTNHPFDNNVDINGDDWCDWVSTAARPPHRGDIDEPTLTDFIFFGNPKRMAKVWHPAKGSAGSTSRNVTNWSCSCFRIYLSQICLSEGRQNALYSRASIL